MIRRILPIAGVALALGLGFWLGQTPPAPADAPSAGAEPAEETVWTCSMDPQVALPEFGACPICGMDLIPRKGNAGGGDPARFSLSPEAARIARVRTAVVERRPAAQTLQLVGEIGYDRTRLADITAWFGGRIERMFVDYAGMRIRKGDHLYRIYSPALITAHAELLQAQRAIKRLAGASKAVRESAQATLEAVRAKLRRWGLSGYQVKQLAKQSKPSDHITLYAPTGGVVVERAKVEGTYVETGTRLYRIADLDWVWVEAWAYEHHLPWLRFGQQVRFRVDALPGQVFEGRISFIDPYLDPKIRANRVRVSVANPEGLLKPGMFARVEVRAELAGPGHLMAPELAGKYVCPMHPHVMADAAGRCDVCGMRTVRAEELGYALPDADAQPPLVIPASAPLLTGTRAVVYVADQSAPEPTYIAREVQLGPRAGDHYVVLSGLMPGEHVVVEGAFKLDAELQIRAGPSMMNPLAASQPTSQSQPASATSAPHDHAGHDHDHPHDHGHAVASAAPKAKAKAKPKARRRPRRAKKAPRKATEPASQSQATSNPASQSQATSNPASQSQPAKPQAAKPKPKPAAAPAAAALSGQLKRVVEAYLRTQKALAADDAAGAAAAWRGLQAAIKAADTNHPALADRAPKLRRAAQGGKGGLEALRKAFRRVSIQLVPLLRAHPAAGGVAATVFHCPMAFDNGADWLQAGTGRAMNPYFGASMLHCGSRVARVVP